METKHTPILSIRERGGDIVDLTVDNGAIIGCIYKSYADDVVRACNNHDALAEALEDLVFHVSNDGIPWDVLKDKIAESRAAIRQAKGE
jgi:hypothetical protein